MGTVFPHYSIGKYASKIIVYYLFMLRIFQALLYLIKETVKKLVYVHLLIEINRRTPLIFYRQTKTTRVVIRSLTVFEVLKYHLRLIKQTAFVHTTIRLIIYWYLKDLVLEILNRKKLLDYRVDVTGIAQIFQAWEIVLYHNIVIDIPILKSVPPPIPLSKLIYKVKHL